MAAAQIGLTTLTAAIAASSSLSSQVDIGPGYLVGLYVPANWTSANITFQASPDGGATWGELYSYLGQEWTFVAAPSTYLTVDPTQWRGPRSLKVRSGTAASAVNQTASVNVTLIVSL